MGTYLSTPVTEKCQESGESLDCPDVPCAWGVVDMQGWRKSMEDGHTAVTDIPLLSADNQNETREALPEDDPAAANAISDAKVFAVFDGHGGPEVARFCQLYFVSVLQQQPTWKGANLPTDADSPTIPPSYDQEAAGETSVGRALRDCFHSLDRMIDDPSRRDEIMALQSAKPQVGERREVCSIPPPVDMTGIIPPPFYIVHQEPAPAPPPLDLATLCDDSIPVDVVLNDSGDSTTPKADVDEAGKDTIMEPIDQPKSEEDGDSDPSEQDQKHAATDTVAHEEDSNGPETNEGGVVSNNNNDADNGPADDDSDEAVGKDEAVEKDRDMMDDDEGDNDGKERDASSDIKAADPEVGKVKTILQKILALGTTASQSAGQIVVKVQDIAAESTSSSPTNASNATTSPRSEPDVTGPNPRKPSLFHNGRMVCNLPEHPVHAGATAIVAVLTGKILTVANAGDSRAVLCRAGGAVFPLSYDHKPQQDREMTRITRSGGFVNNFGRINGNLNLSRSIGDLKYKQVPGIPPADQMITAEPDIMQVGLQEDDEFIVLGCDGIWDCLSNEDAVEYVRQRIDTRTPTEIGSEMLDQIISTDPRISQGIGGDNMTIMIVDLQPELRSCRKSVPDTAEP